MSIVDKKSNMLSVLSLSFYFQSEENGDECHQSTQRRQALGNRPGHALLRACQCFCLSHDLP